MQSSIPHRRRRRKANLYYVAIPFLLVVVILLSMVAISMGGPGSDINADVTNPTGTTGSTAPTQPTTQPTQPTTQPTQPTEPTTQPTEPTQPTTQPTQPTEPTTQPTEPTQPVDLETFFSETVFIGDSITYGLSTYCNMYKSLYGAKFLCASSYAVRHAIVDPEPGNPNIVSIKYQGESMRPEDALKKMGAKRVFIMLGLNDISFGVDYTLGNWEKLIQNIQEACPDIEIFIQSATPLHANRDKPGNKLNNKNMNLYNEGLQGLCDKYGCHYVDVSSALKDENGQLKDAYCSDAYCHMTYAGLEVWIDTLKEYVSNLNNP